MSRLVFEMVQNSNQEQGADTPRQMLRMLKKACGAAQKKAAVKLQKQTVEHEAAAKWLLNRQIGDSLLASAGEIKKGVTAYNLLNVHSQQRQTVTLNPALDPVRNAQVYYRKAKKGKRGFEKCTEMLEKTEAFLEHISMVVRKIEAALLPDENDEEFKAALNDVSEEARSLGIVLQTPHSVARENAPPAVPFRHLTCDGWDIYIGRNNLQNDEMTLHFAKPWDIWLHVAAHAGSHVVIRRQKNADWPPRAVLEQAASYAVWFSKARYTSYAEVHACEVRYVSKPRKSPPGRVVIQQYKTLRVSPKDPRLPDTPPA